MKILTAAEMQACDRATTERFGTASIQLMRNASAAVAGYARELFPAARQVTVLCGRGNNGGDGMMAARLLAQEGLEVTVLLLGNAVELKGDAAAAWQELNAAKTCAIHAMVSEDELHRVTATLDPDLILDAVVGTGFNPPLKGLPLAALEWVKSSNAEVLAVDLPSGWSADDTNMAAADQAFPADAVVTFTAPKPAHVFGQLTREWGQPVVVAPIGSPGEVVVSELGLEWAGSAQRLYQAPRAVDANKGKFGHVLVVGGALGSAGGKAGAPAMASLAALRTGAGLVTAAVPAPALPVVSSFVPELMTWPLKANPDGQVSPANLTPDQMNALLKGMTVLAVGPGLGQSEDAGKFLTGLLKAAKMPTVIDADGLNLLAKNPKLLAEAARDRTVVLTPHPGEMARLAEVNTADVQARRLEVAREFATRNHVILVLKGARTLVAHPNGHVAVNTTGNPGMAKGGSGDLLTGIIAGMLAQYPDKPGHAVEAAVFLHGLSADLAVRDGDEHSLLATDSLPYFSRAFRFHSRGANGYVWLQGLPPRTTSAKGSREAAE